MTPMRLRKRYLSKSNKALNLTVEKQKSKIDNYNLLGVHHQPSESNNLNNRNSFIKTQDIIDLNK